jgi:serine/threonine protein kinase
LALNEICRDKGYTLLINKINGQCCFLGRGAFGRIFKLVDGRVLKLVLGNDCKQEVNEEFKKLCNAMQLCPDSVFPVVLESYFEGRVNDVDYAGYLLYGVGNPIEIPTTEAISLEFFRELAIKLYKLHSKGIVHGDPRIPNILWYENEYRWIDFRESKSHWSVCQTIVKDVNIFLVSANGEAVAVKPRSKKVDNLIDVYSKEISVENMLKIIHVVHNIMTGHNEGS